MRLSEIKDDWFYKLQSDLHGMNPAYVIECERKRLPLALSPGAAVIDDDCPMCQMLGEETGPVFWHLDGCNVDDEFAFSFFRTREEWEVEQRRWQEFNRQFEQERESGAYGNDARASFDDDEPLIQ